MSHLSEQHVQGQGCPEGNTKNTFATPRETIVHGDTLCFMDMGPSLLQMLAFGGWWLVAVGHGWRLAVGGLWGLALTKKTGFLKTALVQAVGGKK